MFNGFNRLGVEKSFSNVQIISVKFREKWGFIRKQVRKNVGGKVGDKCMIIERIIGNLG